MSKFAEIEEEMARQTHKAKMDAAVEVYRELNKTKNFPQVERIDYYIKDLKDKQEALVYLRDAIESQRLNSY